MQPGQHCNMTGKDRTKIRPAEAKYYKYGVPEDSNTGKYRTN